VNAGLWSATSDWVEVSESTTGLVLTDDAFPGATGGTHTSASYSPIAAVPEPSALLMLSLGVVGLASRRRRS